METTERRISPRTKTRVRITLRRGALVLEGHSVDLSQCGMLVEVGAVPEGVWPYANITLELPAGSVEAVVRRVARRGGHFAYAIVEIDAAGEERLTDFLFETMLRPAA